MIDVIARARRDKDGQSFRFSPISNSQRESRGPLIFAASNLPRVTSNYAVSRNEIRVKVEIVCHRFPRSIRRPSMNIYDELTDSLQKVLCWAMLSPEKEIERERERGGREDKKWRMPDQPLRSTNANDPAPTLLSAPGGKFLIYRSVQFLAKFDNEGMELFTYCRDIARARWTFVKVARTILHRIVTVVKIAGAIVTQLSLRNTKQVPGQKRKKKKSVVFHLVNRKRERERERELQRTILLLPRNLARSKFPLRNILPSFANGVDISLGERTRNNNDVAILF